MLKHLHLPKNNWLKYANEAKFFLSETAEPNKINFFLVWSLDSALFSPPKIEISLFDYIFICTQNHLTFTVQLHDHLLGHSACLYRLICKLGLSWLIINTFKTFHSNEIKFDWNEFILAMQITVCLFWYKNKSHMKPCQHIKLSWDYLCPLTKLCVHDSYY